MKKSKILAAAMASIAMTGSISSCSYNACYNLEPDVYGPPQPYEDPVDESNPQEDNGFSQNGESVESEEYDPILNIEPGVYGPPEAFEDADGN